MIRIIVQEVHFGAAANVGGPVHTYHKTFDIECPELEKYLKQELTYNERSVCGAEIIEDK